MNAGAPLPAAVVFVDDVARMAGFHAALTGMRQVHGDDGRVVLEAAGFQLTVHALLDAHGGATDHALREDTLVKMCLPAPSLAEARRTAAALGGGLWPSDREWQARGFRACDGRDPEGNVFQLRAAAR